MENGSVTQDSKNMALIIWIATIFFGFIPGLVFYLIQKDDAYVVDQAKESLNWSITTLIIAFIGVILAFFIIGFLLLIALGVCNIVFCIMGAVKASSGEPFRVPFAIRLIK